VLNDNYEEAIDGIGSPYRQAKRFLKPKADQTPLKPTAVPIAFTPHEFSQLNATLSHPSWADSFSNHYIKKDDTPRVKGVRRSLDTTLMVKLGAPSISPRRLPESSVQSAFKPLRSKGFSG
jgi:hypothetical protein